MKTMQATSPLVNKKKSNFLRRASKQKTLILMSIPFILYAILFYYTPLLGWLMAFQDFKPGIPWYQQTWVGLKQFKFLFTDNNFLGVLRNTVVMSLMNLFFGTLFSVGFALLLNEIRQKRIKKGIQTISYLPHFLSWIIVTGIVSDMLSPEAGIVNNLLLTFGFIQSPINFFADPKYFWWIVAFANVWKETGWGSIIYLSAMTGINPEMYEAASIDGAGRLQRIWHITMPGIRPTIFIILLINIGNILNAGFEVQYMLGNGLIQSVSQTIDIFVLKYGISLQNYGLATAAGIFKSAVSILLIFVFNRLAKAFGEERLF